MRVVARAPNHLGDGVMALPAMAALAQLGALEVRGPKWAELLYRPLGVATGPPGRLDRNVDVAVLFPPSLRAAWEARRARERIGTATDHRAWLLTRVVAAGTHTRDTYAALARAAGVEVRGSPRYEAPVGPVPDVPEGHVGLDPVAAIPIKEWGGYGDLAAAVDAPVVFYGGPGEQARVAAVAGRHPIRVALPLDAFARALTRCAVFVSNDSGAAHFARACGVPTVVVHGPTVAARTGPHGAISVPGAPVACSPCYRSRCPTDRECLRIPVSRVLAAVAEALDG